MAIPTNLHADVQQQVDIGFSKNEIRQNLITKGYSEPEVTTALSRISIVEAAPESTGGASTKSILLGLLFIFIVIWRIMRLSNGSGNIFLVLGVFTGIGMAIYYFTKRG